MYSLFGGNLVTQKDIVAIQQYTNLIKSGVPVGKAWSQTMTNCSVAAKQQVLQCKNNTQALEELTVAQKANTISAKATSIALKGLSLAANIGIGLLITWGLPKLIELFDKAHTSTEEYAEQFEELKQEYSDVKSELESVNSELETTRQRMEELEGKELTFVEKEEYDNLKKTNAELERQNALLEAQEKIKNKEKNEAFVNVMNSESDSRRSVKVYNESGTATKNLSGKELVEFWDDETLRQLEKAKNRMAVAVTQDTTQEQLDSIQDLIDDYSEKAMEQYNEYAKKAEGMSYIPEPSTETDKAVNEWLDYINDYQDRMMIAMGESGSKTNAFNRIIDNWYFDETVQELQDLGEQGQVTAEMLNDPKYDEFIDKLVLLGVIDSADNLEDIALAFNDITESVGGFSNKISDSSLKGYLSQDVDEIKSLKDELFNLFKSGTLNENSINGVKGFRDMLTETGLSAKEAVGGIEQFFEASGEVIDLSDWRTQLNDARDAISSLSTIKDEIDSGYSESSIDTIISDYPQLLAHLNDETTMLNEVNRLLEEQEEKAEIASDKLLEFDPSISYAVIQQTYQELETSNSGLIQTLAEGYGIDLNNFSTLAQAKEEIDKQLLQTLMEMWGDYYGIVVDSVTGLASITQNTPEFYSDKEAQNQLATYNQIITKLNANADKFKSAVDFSDIGGGASSASKAGEDAGEAYIDALKDKLSDLDDLIGGITNIIGDQIDVLNDQKDAAVDALTAQKEAAEEALEAEKELLEQQKELLQDKIDAKQDEIDAIEEARKQRQLEMDLQLAEYQLQKMLNQKTKLIYSDEKGFHYETDTSEVRNSREEITTIKEDIKITSIEKDISDLENEIDKLDDLIDSIDKQIDESNAYYDSLIESTEKYYDNLIKGLEDYKSRWEELSELEDQAKFQAKLKELGITTNDILSMSDEAFQSVKDSYLNTLSEIYAGDQNIIDSLNELAGTDLSPLSTSMEIVGAEVDKLANKSNSLSTVADNMNSIDESTTALTTNTEGLDENLSNITDSLTNLPNSEGLNGWVDGFTNLGNAIKGVAEALGIAEEDTIGGLVTALQSISEVSLGGGDEEETGIIGQFNALKEAVDNVTTSISGGVSGDSEGDVSNSKSPSMSSGAGEGESSGLVSAIEKMDEIATETLGEGSIEEGSDGEGNGIIGKFSQLKTAVDAVTTAIGTGSDEEGAINLIGALQSHYEKAEETLPEVKSLFEDLLISIESCITALNTMVSTMSTIDDMNLPTGGVEGNSDTGSSGTGGVNGNANINGNAFTNGSWGAKHSGNTLVGELGQELVVDPNTGTWRTVGDNGAEFTDIKRGDIVFNHKQTEAILKHGKITGRGKALANGTVLRPLQEGDSGYALMKSFEIYQDMLRSQIVPPLNAIDNNMDMVVRNISNVNNKTNNFSIGDITIHCTGVTSQEVAKQIGTEVDKVFNGMYLKACQNSLKR